MMPLRLLRYQRVTLGSVLGSAYSLQSCEKESPFTEELFDIRWIFRDMGSSCAHKDGHRYIPAGSGTSGKSEVLTTTQQVSYLQVLLSTTCRLHSFSLTPAHPYTLGSCSDYILPYLTIPS